MNNRLKFKIWDCKDNKWLHPIYKGYLGCIFEPYLVQNGELCFKLMGIDGIKDGNYHCSYFKRKGYDFKVVQYTGLKDKNGKEIYECDIVRTMEHMGVVEYHKGMYCINVDNSFKLLIYDINEFMEVIGNIYETPDLLK